MSRISRKNAARIRRGIKSGMEAIIAQKAGLPYHSVLHEDELVRLAFVRTLQHELHTIARRALRTAKELMG